MIDLIFGDFFNLERGKGGGGARFGSLLDCLKVNRGRHNS